MIDNSTKKDPIDINDDELVVLHTIAPFSRYQQLKSLFAIKKQLGIGIFNRLRLLFRTLIAGMLITVLGLSTLTTNANIVVLEAQQTGWNAEIDTNKMQLLVKAVRPMEVAKDEHCVMWLKTKGKEPQMIAKLPMEGEINISVSPEIVDMLRDAMVIISVENSQDFIRPSRVEYMREPDD